MERGLVSTDLTTPSAVTGEGADDQRPTVDPLGRRLLLACAAGIAAVAALTIPNSILDVGFFTRGVPIRWWELPVALAAGVLVAVWFLIPAPRSSSRTDKRPVVGATFVALLAVGCPTCNVVMMLALGLAGTLRYWAPVQPYLALVSLAVLVVAVVVRWRRRDCISAVCTGRAELNR